MAVEQNKQYVFLVDDEPIQNEMLKDFLSERFKYQFKTYESGESAIQDLGLNPVVIVLDYHLNAHLPDAKNGVEVLKAIKEVKPDAKVVMLSGQDKIEVAIESMKYGAFDYVIKGETAFSRMENIVNYVNEIDNIREANKTYKKVITILFIALIAIIGISIFMAMKLNSAY